MARHTRHIKERIGEVFIGKEKVFVPDIAFALFEHDNNAVRAEKAFTIFLEGLDIFMADGQLFFKARIQMQLRGIIAAVNGETSKHH